LSIVQKKSEDRLQRILASGERVRKTGRGTDGLKEAFFALTNRRIIIFRVGATAMSEPKVAEIPLQYVKSVTCEPPILTAGPILVIESRSGQFRIRLMKEARREASMWPNWILDAQEAAKPKVTPSDDIASKLAQLTALRDSGALTPDEFAAAKARILG
jgi:hypothetical protein